MTSLGLAAMYRHRGSQGSRPGSSSLQLTTTCACTYQLGDVIAVFLALVVAARPVVAGAAAVVRQKHGLGVEQVPLVAGADALDDPAPGS